MIGKFGYEIAWLTIGAVAGTIGGIVVGKTTYREMNKRKKKDDYECSDISEEEIIEPSI